MAKGTKTLAKAIIENVKQGCPYSLTFSPVYLAPEDKEKLEAYLKNAFELYTKSWIIPLAQEIIEK